MEFIFPMLGLHRISDLERLVNSVNLIPWIDDDIKHNNYHNLKIHVVRIYLLHIISKLLTLTPGKKILIPIEFSDQYIGVLCVIKDCNYNRTRLCDMKYGFIRDMRCPINLVTLTPSENVENYLTYYNDYAKIPFEGFITSINENVRNLI